MNSKLRSIAQLLALGAAAAAIITAPAASAAPRCANHGSATVCQGPGHASIHTAPAPVQSPRIYGPFSTPLPLLFD